jgi:hypothetical protein
MALVIVSVLILFASFVTASVGGAVLWSLRKLRPQQDLEVEVSGQRAMLQNLEAQIIHLRTKAAGRRSAERKQAAATPVAPDSEDDPLLEGLTDDDKMLFR